MAGTDGRRGSGAPRSGKPRGGRPSSGPPRTGRPGSGKPGASSSGKPNSGAPRSAAPRSGKPGEGKARSGRPAGAGPSRRPDTRSGTRPAGPRDPQLTADIKAEDLDPAVLNELRTLPEGLAEIVGRHLVAADLALVDGDTSLARQHTQAARRRAGRVAAVREADGVAAYLDGDYAAALSELRTVRRMTGNTALVPLLADCERGLGRPLRALDLVKEVDLGRVDPDTRVELLLVASGARADLGQGDAAVLVLQVPELKRLPRGSARARLQYGYSEALARVGRDAEARTWLEAAAASDVDGVTDAAERLDETVTFDAVEGDEDEPTSG